MDKIHDFESNPKSFGKANANDNISAESSVQRVSMPPPTFQLKANNIGDEAEEKEEKVSAEPAYQLAAEGSEPPSEPPSLNDDGATPNKPNNTGLPNQLKSGVESLSGFSLDDVNVHYNSPKPAQLKAHAYAQGTDIHVASGQEKHLPHEAWHVVQQKQGRVQATTQMKGIGVNDDSGLEKEADVMGAKAANIIQKKNVNNNDLQQKKISNSIVQKNDDLDDEWAIKSTGLDPTSNVVSSTNKYLHKKETKQQLRDFYGVKHLRHVVDKFGFILGCLQRLDELIKENRYGYPNYSTGTTTQDDLRRSIRSTAEKIQNFSFANNDLSNRQALFARELEIRMQLKRISQVRKEKTSSKKSNKKVTKSTISDLKTEKKTATEDRKGEIDKTISKVKSIKYGTHYIDFSRSSFANLLNIIEPIMASDVGSQSVTISFGLSQGLGGVLKVGGGISVDQTLWVEDDKRIRMKNGINLNLFAEAGFQDIAGVNGEIGGGFGRVKVFNSPEQWAAYTGQQCLQKLLNGVQISKSLSKKHAKNAGFSDDKVNDMSYLQDMGINSELVAEINKYSAQKVTKVNVVPLSADISGNFLFLGGGLGASHKSMFFSKEDGDGEKKQKGTQNTLSFSLNVGSLFNIQTTLTWIKNHANPDNDGFYINLKLSSKMAKLGQGFDNPGIEGLCIENLNNFKPFDGTDLTELNGDGESVIKPVYDALKKIFDPSEFLKKIHDSPLMGSFSVGMSTTPSIEATYIGGGGEGITGLGGGEGKAGLGGKGGMRLLYIRSTVDKSADVSGTVYTGGPVNVDLGLNLSRSSGNDIKIGTDSLAYVLTVFSGYNKRMESRENASDSKGKDEWKEFVAKNKSDLSTIFEKISNRGDHKRLNGELDSIEGTNDDNNKFNQITMDNGFDANLTALENILIEHDSKRAKF